MKKHLCLIAAAVIAAGGCTGRSDAAPRAAGASRPATVAAPSAAPRRSITVVFLGDSIARGTGDEAGRGFASILEQELERRGIGTRPSLNLAMDGARTRHVLDQLRRERVRDLVGRADLVVLSVGGNDLFVDSQGRRAELRDADRIADEILIRLAEVIQKIRDVNPAARIFLLALYNPFFDSSFAPLASAYVQQWNAKLASRFHGQDGVEVIQTSDLLNRPDRLGFDNFHPSGKGYELIAARIAAELAGR